MRKPYFQRLVTLILVFLLFCGVSLASSSGIKDVVTNYKKYKNKTFSVEGTIISIVDHTPMNIMIFGENMTSESQDSKEINLYYLSNASEGVYILSLKHFETEAQAKFKVKMIVTSTDEVDAKAVELYDKYIQRKCGFSSPDFSESALVEWIGKLPNDTFWVLLIDVE